MESLINQLSNLAVEEKKETSVDILSLGKCNSFKMTFVCDGKKLHAIGEFAKGRYNGNYCTFNIYSLKSYVTITLPLLKQKDSEEEFNLFKKNASSYLTTALLKGQLSEYGIKKIGKIMFFDLS
jgi:hypothetical protein